MQELTLQDYVDILNLIMAVNIPFSQAERALEIKKKIEQNIAELQKQ